MENNTNRADRGKLEQAMKESFTKWHKAYEMLAAGEEPDKEKNDDYHMDNDEEPEK